MERKKIKVLMVVPNLRVSNGVASFVMSYYRKIDHQLIDMDFVCYRNIESPYVAEIEKNNDKVYFLPRIKSFRQHMKKCREIIKNGNYDIIHDNSLILTYPLMRMAKSHIQVRILHSHNTKLGETPKKELRNKMCFPLLLKTCNAFAACSSIAGSAVFGKREFTVIPNVIISSKFAFSESCRKKKRDELTCDDKIVIGAVGRLAYQKNPYFAIDVIEKALLIRDDIVFWWIGSGQLDQQVKDYVKRKNLDKKVTFFGSRNDVAELYQAMDVFFLPSIFEGFGLACLEAQAAGLPCVISTEFPQEVNVSGFVSQVSLDSSIDVWAKEILRMSGVKVDRNKAVDIVSESDFSDSVSGHKLSEFYFQLLDKENGVE